LTRVFWAKFEKFKIDHLARCAFLQNQPVPNAIVANALAASGENPKERERAFSGAISFDKGALHQNVKNRTLTALLEVAGLDHSGGCE
jgi:hypothetical protein